MTALLAALPARAGAQFGAGVHFASATDGPARRDGAVSLELGYTWRHAAVAVNVLGTAGFSGLQTTLASARARWMPLAGPLTPYLGAGAGVLGQAAQCPAGQTGCATSSSVEPAAVSEVGLLLRQGGGNLALSADLIVPMIREPSTGSTPAHPVPVLLFGVRLLGGG